MATIRQFLTSKRASAALESAIAIPSLLIILTGVVDTVMTCFASDLLKRAAYRVVYLNALDNTLDDSHDSLYARVEQAIEQELNDLTALLDYELVTNVDDCPDVSGDTDVPPLCLSVNIRVFNNPTDMYNNAPSGLAADRCGGGSDQIVVVRAHLKPRQDGDGISLLSVMQQQIFGEAGIKASAVLFNEERYDPDSNVKQEVSDKPCAEDPQDRDMGNNENTPVGS